MFRLFWLRCAGFAFDELAALALPADDADFDRHMDRSRTVVAELLTRPPAAEALLLSNPDSLDRITALAQTTGEPVNSRARQRLRLGWNYLQRFHAKNDTCSFFGPLAWGRVDRDANAALTLTVAEPGAPPLRRRRVVFEQWVVDGLAEALRDDLSTSVPARLHSGCDLDGDTVRVPDGRQIPVNAEAMALLRLAQDGRLDPVTLAAADPSVSAAVSRFLVPDLSLPLGSPDAVEVLTDAVAARAPLGRTGPALAAAHQLVSLREKFERSEGAAVRRGLLGEMSDALTACGVVVTRPKGTMYASRLPVYEDCEQNLTVSMGGAFADRLRDRLLPVLRLYRVLAQCAAARLHARYAEVFDQLDVAGPVDFLTVLRALRRPEQPLWEPVVAELRAQLHDAWAALASGISSADLELTSAGIDRIAASLRESTPEQHRFTDVLGVGVVSPDLLLAEPDLATIDAGQARIVVGEVHPGVLTALQPVVMPFLGDDEIGQPLGEIDALLAPGRILLAPTSRTYHRSQINWPVVPNLWEIMLPGSVGRVPSARRIPAGRGRVVREDGLLRFLDPRTGRDEDLITVLSSDLHQILFALASDVLGGALPHRVKWQRIELKRRSWRFDAATIPEPGKPAESLTDFRSLASWAEANGLPRHCFFKAAGEPKPMYLDWRNPLAVDAFARMAKRSGSVLITEMSPGPDELWLRDGAGRRYCAELRTSFVL
ncbi:MAG TPA: hypothetical protein VJ914_05325 [Pseudonocardiaceae bacterium]|nr:hypothetical protein [Pseudonocardiaceae bacterium]